MDFTSTEIDQAIEIVQRFQKLKTKHDIFYNFCFCILVPQTRFKTILRVVEELKQIKFYSTPIPREKLLETIQRARFKSRKADYLLSFKYSFEKFYPEFMKVLKSETDPVAKRKFVVGRIKGMGNKAASHLLRNLGEVDLAIIDVHILRYLEIKDKKYDYIKVEQEIRDRAKAQGVSIAVLDALIWSKGANIGKDQFVF
jgi:N-glycosylase/DNA lyase